MINLIDNVLNRITTYRLVLYYLILLVVAALGLSCFGFLPFQPVDLLVSLSVLVLVCWTAGTNLARRKDRMRVFVAGSSGAIGSRLVPQLIERRHQVIGTCHSPDKVERLRALGVEPLVLDALDARAVGEAVARARPDAIVHQATALANLRDFKHFDRSFAQTIQLHQM